MSTGPERLAAPPETVDEDPPLTALMTTHLLGITADAPLSTALRLMATTGVRHLPVLEGERCRGVVLEVDIARFVARGSGSPDARAAVHVEELTRPVEPLPVTARRSDAARRMQAEHADAVLVVDGARLVGIVTATDIVRSLASVTSPAAGHRGIEV
ncbi:CBS domain-containing protein [Pseudonocardia xinjiangensis]|uniref:CBS domain-containing protein n=1 Tax=Pseudonocardia xinjiangensis TaxID=75289 RepID=UPI003D920C15